MPTRKELKRRIDDLETPDETPESLYLKMLKDAQPHCDEEFPEAGERFILRYKNRNRK